MKLIFLLILLFPTLLFSQDTDIIPTNCWKEYATENLPYPESEHCPLIICPDNSIFCFQKEDLEIYTIKDGSRESDENRIQIGDAGWKFRIILKTESELHLESIDHPGFKIYLKR